MRKNVEWEQYTQRPAESGVVALRDSIGTASVEVARELFG
jgi:hypothetical protein